MSERSDMTTEAGAWRQMGYEYEKPGDFRVGPMGLLMWWEACGALTHAVAGAMRDRFDPHALDRRHTVDEPFTPGAIALLAYWFAEECDDEQVRDRLPALNTFTGSAFGQSCTVNEFVLVAR